MPPTRRTSRSTTTTTTTSTTTASTTIRRRRGNPPSSESRTTTPVTTRRRRQASLSQRTPNNNNNTSSSSSNNNNNNGTPQVISLLSPEEPSSESPNASSTTPQTNTTPRTSSSRNVLSNTASRRTRGATTMNRQRVSSASLSARRRNAANRVFDPRTLNQNGPSASTGSQHRIHANTTPATTATNLTQRILMNQNQLHRSTTGGATNRVTTTASTLSTSAPRTNPHHFMFAPVTQQQHFHHGYPYHYNRGTTEIPSDDSISDDTEDIDELFSRLEEEEQMEEARRRNNHRNHLIGQFELMRNLLQSFVTQEVNSARTGATTSTGGGVNPALLALSLTDRDFTEADYELLLSLDDNNPHKTVEKSQIANLERKHLSKKEAAEEIRCSICLEEYSSGNEVCVLPCHHLFHPQCVSQWLENFSNNCPVCKLTITKVPPKPATAKSSTATSPGSRKRKRKRRAPASPIVNLVDNDSDDENQEADVIHVEPNSDDVLETRSKKRIRRS